MDFSFYGYDGKPIETYDAFWHVLEDAPGYKINRMRGFQVMNVTLHANYSGSTLPTMYVVEDVWRVNIYIGTVLCLFVLYVISTSKSVIVSLLEYLNEKPQKEKNVSPLEDE
jgi:hypothetical protein